MRSSSFTIPLIASLATGGAARADTLLDTHSSDDNTISLALAYRVAELAIKVQGSPIALPPSFTGAGIYVYPTRNVTIGRLSARVRATTTDSRAPQSGKFVIYQVECDHDSSQSSCAPHDINSTNSGVPATARRFETASVRIPSGDAGGSMSGLATAAVDAGAPGTGLLLEAKTVYAIGFVSTDDMNTLWTGDFPLTLDAWEATPPLPKFNDPNAPALMTFGRGIVFGPPDDPSQDLVLQSFTGLPGIIIEDRPTTTTSGGGSGADAPADADHDGVADTQDNCPTVYNPNQANHDHDGSGDACQSDGGCNAGGGAALPLPAALLALALRRRRRGAP